MFFRDMRIGLRLTCAFGLVLVLMIGCIALGISRLADLDQTLESIINKEWKKTALGNEIMNLTDENAKATLSLAIIKDPAKVAEVARQINDRKAQNTKNLEQLSGLLYLPKGKELLSKIQEARGPYTTASTKAFQLFEQGRSGEATSLLQSEVLPTLDRYKGSIRDIIKFQKELVDLSVAAAKQTYESGRTFSIALGILAALLGSGLAFFITRSITRPLQLAVEVTDKIACGDMTSQIKVTAKDEIGQLLSSLKAMLESLNQMAVAADQVAHGDITRNVEARSDKDVLGKAFHRLIETLKVLLKEMATLVHAAQAGQLRKRCEVNQFDGAYRDMAQGVNGILDAISAPIAEASAVLEKVAARNLSVHMTGDYKGDYAQIKNGLNTAIQNLDEALAQVAVGTEQVTAAAGEISSGSQTLAQGASEQASSLEEVASSLQELSATAGQNATNAQEARSMSDHTRQSAGKGVENMRHLSEAVIKIKASADATAKIVKTIDEIAFQTNLLALNAAVEAARAGDAGKGFAVVAEEVRNLAMRSAEAAKNTANLIEESVKNAESGVTINQEVLSNLNEIHSEINKVTEVMATIAAASDQQRQGVGQINTAIEQMNQVVQQTAANAEESASAAEELSGQAEEMRGMVSSFELSTVGRLVPGTKDAPKRRQVAPPRKPVAQPVQRKPVPVAVKSDKRGSTPEKMIPLTDQEDTSVLQEF
ncbi:MAG: MCP four helix bundle domain-containing protein [Acidobacteria bacterium]|nr:MCP four helix bundle domain-containing protein [Acidobacteriota bacterium]